MPALSTTLPVETVTHTSTQSSRAQRRVSSAIVGCGKISEQHLLVLKEVANVSIASLCDQSAALARFSAQRFGVGGWHTHLGEMLEACRPDVVHILTPPATHETIARACMAAGAHVIVEKPVALSNPEFQDTWKCACQHGVRLIENHNYRFNGPVAWLDQTIARGTIGRVEEVEVRMALRIRDGGRYADQNAPHPSHKLPAGVIHEFISHLCYLALQFFPTDPESIRAVWRNLGADKLFKYDDLDALVRFPTGTARLRFTCQHWPDEFSITARGTAGQAYAELFYPTCRLTRRRGGSHHLVPTLNSLSAARASLTSGIGGLWNKIAGRTAYEGLERFLQETYVALANGTEPPVTYSDMDRTSRLIDALLLPENQV